MSKGITERGPTEIRDQTLPWLEESVECLRCAQRWIAARLLGTDYRRMKCPFCGARNSELDGEAPLLLPSRH